jgi:TolB-like protein
MLVWQLATEQRSRRVVGRPRRPVSSPTASIPQPATALPVDRGSPFAKISNNPEQQYFIDGISNDLATVCRGLSGCP